MEEGPVIPGVIWEELFGSRLECEFPWKGFCGFCIGAAHLLSFFLFLSLGLCLFLGGLSGGFLISYHMFLLAAHICNISLQHNYALEAVILYSELFPFLRGCN